MKKKTPDSSPPLFKRPAPKPRPAAAPTHRRGNAKFTDEEALWVLDKLVAGADLGDLARQLKVSYKTILDLKNGLTYQHIPRPVGSDKPRRPRK